MTGGFLSLRKFLHDLLEFPLQIICMFLDNILLLPSPLDLELQGNDGRLGDRYFLTRGGEGG